MIFQALLSSLVFSRFILALDGLEFNNFPGRSFFNLKKISRDLRVDDSRRNIMYPPWRTSTFKAGGPSPSSQDIYPRNLINEQFHTAWDYTASPRKASPSSKSVWSSSNTQGWGQSPFEEVYSVRKPIRTTSMEKTTLENPTEKNTQNPPSIDENTSSHKTNSQIQSDSIYNQTPKNTNKTEKTLITPRPSKKTEKLINSLFEHATNDNITITTATAPTITTTKSMQDTTVPGQPVKRRVQYKYSPVTNQPEATAPKHQSLAPAQYKYSPVTQHPEPVIPKQKPLSRALPAVPPKPHPLPLSPAPPHAAPLSYPAITYSHMGQDCRVEDSVVQAEVCTPTLDTQCSPISLRGTKVTSCKSLTLLLSVQVQQQEKCLPVTRTVCAMGTG